MTNIIKLFENNIGKLKTIKKLSGGLSNDIYLVNRKYLWKRIKNKYLFDHQNEIDIMTNSEYFDLYYKDDDNICYNYIEGTNISEDEFYNKIDQVLKETKKFHNIKVKTKNFWNDIVPEWLRKIDNNEYYVKIYQIINNELLELHDDNDLVLCHHDIHSGNIIKNNNNMSLIDLEFSFQNYYYVDLGNIICELFADYDNQVYNYEKINDDLKLRIINMYHNSNNKDLLKKINIGIKISHFYWCIWGILVNSNNNNKEFDYLKFSLERKKFLN